MKAKASNVGAEIPINEVDTQCLETLFGKKFSRGFVRERLEILREFDKLVLENDQSLRKEIDAVAPQLPRTTQATRRTVHSERAVPTNIRALRRKVTNGIYKWAG